MLDPKHVIKIIIRYRLRNFYINILHGFLTVQLWKDFSLGWWNELASHGSQQASAILKIWRCGSHFALFTRSCMKSQERTFAQVGTTVHDNIFEVLIAGSLSYLYLWLPTPLFYLHRGTSLIGSCWHGFSGQPALGLSFRERKCRNGQICPFSSEDNVLLTRGSRPCYF